MSKNDIQIKNRRAYFDFEILDKFDAGIKLKGTEIKSIREGKANINEAFCIMNKKLELFVKNMYIGEYSHGSPAFNHEPLRERKLLLHKKELERLYDKSREKGLTIIPLRLYINERSFAKLEIGLGRGKKSFDKRESIKEKENKRNIDRILKQYK